MNLNAKNLTEQTRADTPELCTTCFCVYENQVYIGETVFDKKSILIGKSRDADLVLDCQSIADIHALVELKKGQAILFNKNIGNGLRLNGLSIKESLLRAEDVIELGPFSIVFKRESVQEARTFLSSQTTSATRAPADNKNKKNVVPIRKSRMDEEGSSRKQIRIPAAALEDESLYSIILLNSYPSKRSWQKAVESFAILFRIHPDKAAKLFEKPQLVLKSKISRQIAQRTKTALEKAGVLCCIVADGESIPVIDDPSISISALTPSADQFVTQGKSTCSEDDKDDASFIESETTYNEAEKDEDAFFALDPEPEFEQAADEKHSAIKSGTNNDETDKDGDTFLSIVLEHESVKDQDENLPPLDSKIYCDEDDEEDPWEAPFNLKERLLAPVAETATSQKRPLQVQVVKSIGHRVVDTSFVAKGSRYIVSREYGRYRLVESKAQDDVFVYFETGMEGYLDEPGMSRVTIDNLCKEENLHNHRKQLYRIAFPDKARMVLYQEQCRYDISMTEEIPSPAVQVPAKEKTLKWQHWGYSSAMHLFCILILSVYAYVTGVHNVEQKPHFVKVDMSKLQAMEAKKEIKPPPPKKEMPQPKPEPVKVAEKLKKPSKKKPTKKVVQASKSAKTSSKRAASARQASRDPNAGGGFGKGNIKNRNVNQAGLLSILGSNAVPGPSTAIASVTNIDAVKVPGASEKNFTVGGIKGSLGTGKITVGTSGGVVTTKGSKQVLRSAGASGPGTVAALEKGTTGQKSVKGMVTARMSRSVKIEGGMSREMVKRVIDQHLSEITYCYESALVGNPSISGRVIFEWKILMNGRVGEIRIVASSINSHQIHDCIKGAIKSWQFPKPSGAEVVVSYPFIFDLVAF